LPLTGLFFIVTFIRNILYNVKILKTVNINVPIISVGNLSTGGTGKTPFIIFLARYYLRKGKNVGIISRGYRRTSVDLVLVSDGKNINSSPEEAGDEVYMMAQDLIKDFHNFTIVSSSNRIKASAYILQNYKCDLILLDDAFQHRHIHRDIDFVIIDANKSNNFSDKLLLPSGNLRECPIALKRCSMIILNHKFTKTNKVGINLNKFNKPIVNINYKTNNIYNNRGDVLNAKGQRTLLFCGIAEPDSFIFAVENEGVLIDKILKFRDHYIYSKKDIDYLENYNTNEIIFITTEKDFVKLLEFQDFVDNFPVYFLKMDVEINDGIKLLEKELNSVFIESKI
jgi:tetraacyldisaccharide 4'-kinase